MAGLLGGPIKYPRFIADLAPEQIYRAVARLPTGGCQKEKGIHAVFETEIPESARCFQDKGSRDDLRLGWSWPTTRLTKRAAVPWPLEDGCVKMAFKFFFDPCPGHNLFCY
jgi:hypothetical protein